MDSNELKRLREKYGRMTDEEIKELLLAGRDEFEPDAFNLLLEEARKRQVELGTEIAASQQDVPEAQALEKELEEESYAELAVVNSQEDMEFIRKQLSTAGINFYFQPISFSGKELPVALLVEQSRANDAIEKLKDFAPKGSIVLW
jgi:beta-phosphoglucomutase-like phosphatase (HAD superfamily)